MPRHVTTVVTAMVEPGREADLAAGFEELLRSAVCRPRRALRTTLLRAEEGEWRIQTLWRDRAALDAMSSAVAKLVPDSERLTRSTRK